MDIEVGIDVEEKIEQGVDVHDEQQNNISSTSNIINSSNTKVTETIPDSQENSLPTVISDRWLNQTVRIKDGTAGIIVKVECGWYYIESKSTGETTKLRRNHLKKYDPNIVIVSTVDSTKPKQNNTNNVQSKKSNTDSNKRKHSTNDENGVKQHNDSKSSRHNSSTSASTLDTTVGIELCQPTSATPSIAPSVVLSMRDKSRGLILSKDQLTCYGSEVSRKEYTTH